MPVSPSTERRNWSRTEPVPCPINGASATNPIDFRQNSSRSPARVGTPLDWKLRHLMQQIGDAASHRCSKRPHQRRCDHRDRTAIQAFLCRPRCLQANSSNKHRDDHQRSPAVRDIGDVDEECQCQQQTTRWPAAAAAPATPSTHRHQQELRGGELGRLRDVVLDRDAGRSRSLQEHQADAAAETAATTEPAARCRTPESLSAPTTPRPERLKLRHQQRDDQQLDETL